MLSPIEHIILIRADASRIYRALTEREDVAAWWGVTVAPGDEAPNVWIGMDREQPISIAATEQDRSLTLTLRQQHPVDDTLWVDARIVLTIEPRAGYCLVKVTHVGVPDGEWRDLVREGWVEVLCYLQAWVESGRAAALLNDLARFSTIERKVEVPANATECWNAVTGADAMATGFSDSEEPKVHCDPELGGQIGILRSDGSHVGGEVVLSTAPSDWVVHWWDADSLARTGDPGMITVQRWHIAPMAEGGCVIRLAESGYDLAVVTDTWMQEIETGWDGFMANLKSLLTSRTGETV